MGARRKARECGLQVLYQLEAQTKERPPPGRLPTLPLATPLARVTREEASVALHAFFDHFDAPERTHMFCEELVSGVVEHLTQLDALLGEHSPRWRVERMAAVDRNALRLAAYELLYAADVPVKVILDEAIDIASRYGSEQSGAFVNGILDSLAKTVRAAELTPSRE